MIKGRALDCKGGPHALGAVGQLRLWWMQGAEDLVSRRFSNLPSFHFTPWSHPKNSLSRPLDLGGCPEIKLPGNSDRTLTLVPDPVYLLPFRNWDSLPNPSLLGQGLEHTHSNLFVLWLNSVAQTLSCWFEFLTPMTGADTWHLCGSRQCHCWKRTASWGSLWDIRLGYEYAPISFSEKFPPNPCWTG